jgi:hypothetical protein
VATVRGVLYRRSPWIRDTECAKSPANRGTLALRPSQQERNRNIMKTMPILLGSLAACAIAAAFPPSASSTDDSSALAKSVAKSKHTLAEGIKQVSHAQETAISAKFEFDDNGKLSLSVYTAEKGLGVDAEHNVLKEYGGSPEQPAWKPEIEIFKDVAHVARASQQQTLMALAKASLADIVAKAEKETNGQALSVTPIIEGHQAFFAVKTVAGDKVVDAKFKLLGGDEDDDDDERGEKH